MNIGVIAWIGGLLFSGFGIPIVIALRMRRRKRKEQEREKRKREWEIVSKAQKILWAVSKTDSKNELIIPTSKELKVAIEHFDLLNKLHQGYSGNISYEYSHMVKPFFTHSFRRSYKQIHKNYKHIDPPRLWRRYLLLLQYPSIPLLWRFYLLGKLAISFLKRKLW